MNMQKGSEQICFFFVKIAVNSDWEVQHVLIYPFHTFKVWIMGLSIADYYVSNCLESSDHWAELDLLIGSRGQTILNICKFYKQAHTNGGWEVHTMNEKMDLS